ncbi:unnamed protein product, partial [marine sediment metagenome]
HYKVYNEDYVLQIGPEVVSISSYPGYNGWENFSNVIFDCFKKIKGLGIINNVSRLGIRYINFFETNVFNNVALKIDLHGKFLTDNNSFFRTEITHDDFTSNLQIGNNITQNKRIGSIIDIDTFKSFKDSEFFNEMEVIINRGHEFEKSLFYSLLREEYLNTLNPVY